MSFRQQNIEECTNKIDIFPTINDIHSSRPNIEPNIIDRPYDDVEHYLDIHFHLFREDFIRPLREGIQQYLEEMKSPSQNTISKKRDGIFVHENVFLKKDKHKKTNICCFNSRTFHNIDWKVSRRKT